MTDNDERGGGAQPDAWRDHIFVQTMRTGCLYKPGKDLSDQHRGIIIGGLDGIAPNGALEDMIAAQMRSCHDAAMECYAAAMTSNVTSSLRREYLGLAGKLSRTFAMLLDTLNHHRGKGQQKITVEHVHVHSGRQAVVGIVEAPGGGAPPKSEDQAHARKIADAPRPAMLSADEARDTMPVASDAERPLPDARRKVAGRPEGE